MLLIIGMVLAAIGLIYLVLSSVLPIMQSSRTDPYTAYTGAGQAAGAAQPAEYVSPTEAILGVVWRGMGDSKFKRSVAVGPAFHWGTLLDRMLAGALLGGGLGLIIFAQPLIAAIAFVAVPVILYFLARRRAKTYEQKFLIQLP
ncbi:MAG TPA: hypothetical protein VG329_07660, partial [Candidatus Dormibacteraeota bacterium]|nr:hypothetical protein [Candidatus Dormibacteraeota bacterium]